MEDRKMMALGGVTNEDLIDARRTLHWAIAAASAPGKQLIPARPDASEQSLVWDGARSAFLQGVIAGVHESFRSAPRKTRRCLRFLPAVSGTPKDGSARCSTPRRSSRLRRRTSKLPRRGISWRSRSKPAGA
ncbi:MAG TPA: hypothetical protein VGS22_00335 [Thermoanaerobaculia bacterium]|jgi:hypothetical protein|nr:hypothetical protein [Thermoanaerobaculia bacterium]